MRPAPPPLPAPPGPLELFKVTKLREPRRDPECGGSSKTWANLEKGAAGDPPDPAAELAAASPGLRDAVRSSPAAAQGLSSCAPRLRPRPPRGPAPASSPSPLPGRVAASLPHVTREQLWPESPSRGGEGRSLGWVKAKGPGPGRQHLPLLG